MPDEVMDLGYDDTVAGEDIGRLASGKEIFPPGVYILRVEGVMQRIAGHWDDGKDKPGGYSLTFGCVAPPEGVEPPNGTWELAQTQIDYKFWAPGASTAGRAVGERIGKQQLAQLIRACGVSTTGQSSWKELLDECMGKEVQATVTINEWYKKEDLDDEGKPIKGAIPQQTQRIQGFKRMG